MHEEKKTPLYAGITYGLSLFMAAGSVAGWLLLIALFQVYLAVVLSFFPQTRYVSHATTDWLIAALSTTGILP
jgi:hypothetical protein